MRHFTLQDDVKFIARCLKHHKFFKKYVESKAAEICRVIRYRVYQKNSFVFYQGDLGEEFFIVYRCDAMLRAPRAIARALQSLSGSHR